MPKVNENVCPQIPPPNANSTDVPPQTKEYTKWGLSTPEGIFQPQKGVEHGTSLNNIQG
jgi:hypothetical protein